MMDIMDDFRDAMNQDEAAKFSRPTWTVKWLPIITIERFAEFLEVVEDSNFYWVSRINYNQLGKRKVAGKFLISPKGIENVRLWMIKRGTPLSE